MVAFFTATANTCHHVSCLIVNDCHSRLFSVKIIFPILILPSIHDVADDPLQLIMQSRVNVGTDLITAGKNSLIYFVVRRFVLFVVAILFFFGIKLVLETEVLLSHQNLGGIVHCQSDFVIVQLIVQRIAVDFRRNIIRHSLVVLIFSDVALLIHLFKN